MEGDTSVMTANLVIIFDTEELARSVIYVAEPLADLKINILTKFYNRAF